MYRTRVSRRIAVLVVLAVAALLGGEFEHWRSSHRRMGTRPGQTGSGEAIVVLGFRNRRPRANAVNRWRSRPDLAERLVPAADYRFGELMLVKPALAVLGRWSLRRSAVVRPGPGPGGPG